MRILVYPHTMELGGSQLNAIELAAATRDLGHEVLIYSADGELVPRVDALGLERVPMRPSRLRPGPATAADLAGVVRNRSIDVIHGWEWPPILEGFAAATRSRSALVGTVMSMDVAPFLPASMSLTVGTAQIVEKAQRRRPGAVHLLEPPVDTDTNAPGNHPSVPLSVTGLDPEAFLVVIVCRLVRSLKLEGILTSIEAIDQLATRHRIQLLVVGDGTAGGEVRTAAHSVNGRHDAPIILTPGEFSDPRWAYGHADLAIGMGGSALRAMAFGTPLIVQGEGGFFELLDRASQATFLHQGWYGVGHVPQDVAASRLAQTIESLVVDAERRRDLGALAREIVVERYSLPAAARVQEKIYRSALKQPYTWRHRGADAARSGAGLLAYKAKRRVDRVRGRWSEPIVPPY